MFTPFSSPRYLTGIRPLIVVLRHDHIEPALPRLHEDGIAGQGSTDIHPLGTGGGDGGGDDARFFIAKQPTFASMRVQARNRDTRSGDAKRACTLMCQPDRGHLGRKIGTADRLNQRTVDCDQNCADLIIGQHHRHPLRPAEIGEDLGMAGIAKTRRSQRFLVDRRGHDARNAPGPGQLDGGGDGVIGRKSGLGRNLTQRWQCCKMRGRQQIQTPGIAAPG